MTLTVFPSPYHTVRHIYPTGDQQKFGRGYTFAVKPQLPLQRTFVLNFASMQWDAPDTKWDMQTLITYYEDRELWDRFTYTHVKYGDLIVRFAKALEVPAPLIGGTGWTEPLEIQLVEQPL